MRKACAAAWKAVTAPSANPKPNPEPSPNPTPAPNPNPNQVTAASAQPGAAFDEHFELEVAPLPHRAHEAPAYAAALEVSPHVV